MPASLFAHDKDGREGEIDHSEQADLDQMPGCTEGDLSGGPGIAVARIVHQNVEPGGGPARRCDHLVLDPCRGMTWA